MVDLDGVKENTENPANADTLVRLTIDTKSEGDCPKYSVGSPWLAIVASQDARVQTTQS